MSENKNATLVFIPFPVMSHLVVSVKTANLLVDRDERLSITILIMKLPIDTKISSYIKNSPHSRINFIELPENSSSFSELTKSPKNDFVVRFMESQTGLLRAAVAEIIKGPNKVAGFVLDMFCTAMIDVANEFPAPSYIFFTCGSGTLGLMFHLQSLEHDQNQDLKEYEDTDFEISVPTFVNPVPARVWPSPMFEKESGFLDMMRKFRETKGIMINTFLEFEPHAIKSLTDDEKIPRIYPVGPILQSGPREEPDENEKIRDDEIMEWLDGQPHSSVLYLCFGSRGCFDEDQLKKIAVGLESSGHRFLWSLRKPPPKEKIVEFPGEYENPEEVLPEGFLERTVGIGKVIGWAPQMAVLSHRAVGGFVSHCGWNSTLESVWCGIPMATLPLDAEQQLNAFELVKELGMAEAIRIDYKRDWRGEKPSEIIGAEEIEAAIRWLMAAVKEGGSEVRRKVKEMQKKSRIALEKGGSSHNALSLFIEDVMRNIE